MSVKPVFFRKLPELFVYKPEDLAEPIIYPDTPYLVPKALVKPTDTMDTLIKFGQLYLLFSLGKSIKEQGVGEATEKFRGLAETVLNSQALIEAVRGGGNALASLMQASAGNRITAFAGPSIMLLLLRRFRLIPDGTATHVAIGAIAGAEIGAEYLEGLAGILPFSKGVSDTDFPTTIVYQLPDRGVPQIAIPPTKRLEK